MWPPRFTPSSSPPNAQSRSTSLSSTAPRHPSHLGPNVNSHPRPQFSPRSSSLSVSAKFNTSTTSLNSPRHGPGSGLKQEVLATSNIRDPLDALEEVVGKALLANEIQDKHDVDKKPDVLVEEVEFGDVSLSELALIVNDHQLGEFQLDKVGLTVEEYDKDTGGFEDLHRSISGCDDVLKSVEISLTRFQNDLGAVSAEIETLQNRSMALNTKLENRKRVEKLLGPAIEHIFVAPAVVKKLSEDVIDQDWFSALEILQRRLTAIDQRIKGSETILAISDLKPLLDDLVNRAIERIRDFFVSQIKALRSPNINAQVIQQRAFLVYKDLFAFMSNHQPQLAEDIIQAYSNTMRWYYLSNFTRYMQALEKMPLYVVEKPDALGHEQINQRGLLASSSNFHKSPNPLSLGRRLEILTRSAHAALPSHVALETKSPTYIESVFRAFTTAVTDNACAEYTFLTSFYPPTATFSSLSRTFANIFTPTFELGHSFTKQLVESNYDALGVLLCVRIIQHHAFTLQRRKCPVAEGWVNGTNMLLWPRFQVAMDMHIESVKKVTNTSSSNSRATMSLTSSKADDGKGSTSPHPLAQRFAQLLQGILALCNNDPAANASNASQTLEAVVTSSDMEPVGRSLERLRGEVEAFLAKTAKGLSQGKKEKFLGNNYSLILTVVGDTGGGLARLQRTWFEERRDSLMEA